MPRERGTQRAVADTDLRSRVDDRLRMYPAHHDIQRQQMIAQLAQGQRRRIAAAVERAARAR